MKKLLTVSSLLSVLLALVLWSCKKDDSMNPSIEGLAIDNYDIIQLTNDNPDVPVYISFNDDVEIDSVSIRIFPLNGTSPVASNAIRNFIHSSTGRTLVKTPFPFPGAGGPTGVYTIEYTITDKKGKTSTQSYNVHILNNKIQNLCTFPSLPLPAGKNVWVRVTSTQPIAPTEHVYVTGSFEQANGGAGDWTGGVTTFRLNRVGTSNQCFYIALNLTGANEFKFTLGDWGREALGNTGQTPPNSTWNSQATQDFIIYNWRTKPVVNQTIPQVLPAQGIATGNMSVIADVGNNNDVLKYYLVQKGGNLADKSRPMYRIMNGATGTNQLIGSVPKSTTVEYIIVRDNAGVVKKGVNAWGFEVAAKWDGITNPVRITTPFFEGDAGIMSVPAALHIVGGATPNGWNNPTTPAQKFTLVSPGKFEIASLALTSGQAYLLLPIAGGWDPKYGGNGKLGGDIIPQGPDVPSPDVNGNYKITVDFTTGKYTLVKL
ncbi:MAG: hypothetical protein H7Y42_18890 [Chitinophagaceae bacterium]|nr:hypothetical protein [Chitinophagaceae bacterium]